MGEGRLHAGEAEQGLGTGLLWVQCGPDLPIIPGRTSSQGTMGTRPFPDIFFSPLWILGVQPGADLFLTSSETQHLGRHTWEAAAKVHKCKPSVHCNALQSIQAIQVTEAYSLQQIHSVRFGIMLRLHFSNFIPVLFDNLLFVGGQRLPRLRTQIKVGLQGEGWCGTLKGWCDASWLIKICLKSL